MIFCLNKPWQEDCPGQSWQKSTPVSIQSNTKSKPILEKRCLLQLQMKKTLWVRRPWRRLPRGLWRTFRDEITRSRMRWRNLECFAWRLRLLCSAARANRADQVAAAGQRQQHREAKHASLPPPRRLRDQCSACWGWSLGPLPCTAHCLS